MAQLKFSSVDNADLALFLQALHLWNRPAVLQIQEDLRGRRILEFIGDDHMRLTSRTVVVKALLRLSPLAKELLPTGHDAQVSQWLDFACDTVLEELHATRDLEGQVFAPLHTALAHQTFLAGTAKPSAADWTLFALLFPKVKALIPSVAAKYYRLVRWTNYLQHIFLERRQDDLSKENAETSVFVPAVFDMRSILAVLSGTVTATPSTKNAERPAKRAAHNAPPKKEKTSEEPRHPFSRVDLRVGRITRVERHPNADRLYVEQVDLGNGDERVVVSGLVEHVPMEDLQDRQCIFICNLKPATLCKVLSSAMLLVAKDESSGVLEPLVPPAGAVPGDRIVLDGVTPKPDELIKPKDSTWETVRVVLKMTDGVAHYEQSPLVVAGKGPLTSTKVSSGTIS